MTKSRTATIQCSILKDFKVRLDSLTVFDLPETHGQKTLTTETQRTGHRQGMERKAL
jgi:hypothetical protein